MDWSQVKDEDGIALYLVSRLQGCSYSPPEWDWHPLLMYKSSGRLHSLLRSKQGVYGFHIGVLPVMAEQPNTATSSTVMELFGKVVQEYKTRFLVPSDHPASASSPPLDPPGTPEG